MKAIDLQSLNNEQIQKLGLSRHDLWIVKLGDEVFGPFESASLKDYAAENENTFNEALASRLDAQDWRPFFSYALFQRRNPQLVESKTSDGPFWIMDFGLKLGPLSGRELEKRIEMGTLGLTDIVSVDDGHSWQKIYQLSGFDRRFHSGQELPMAPLDSDLQEARLELLERIESGEVPSAPSMALAEMAHLARSEAKVIPLRLDEVPLKTQQEVPVSSALKWFIPTAVMAVFGLIVTFNFISTDDELVAMEKADIPRVQKAKSAPVAQRIDPPQPQRDPVVRAPASVPQFRPPRRHALNNAQARESQYPTQIETHNNRYPSHQAEDPYVDPRDEYQDERVEHAAVPRRTHSLVRDAMPAHQSEDINLDAAMNGDYVPQDEPMVEEVSDF